MYEDLWQLVLIDDKGHVVARATECGSKAFAEALAHHWNRGRSRAQKTGWWVVSQVERTIPQWH